ncbi:MAG: glycoside-pentoside-hexuronide (GPH):cation symporter [Eubacteriales bacterium]
MNNRRNVLTFGMGTIGRDMVYSLVSMYLPFYLTDALDLPDALAWIVNTIILAARIFDAVNDPIMGTIVDNTKTKWGKFKPWITVGMIMSAVFTVLMFTTLGLTGTKYIIYFGVVYILWGISWTMNDISYWSMLPALSTDQKSREKIGATARIFANIGLAAAVVGIQPLTSSLGEKFGSLERGYTSVAIGVVVIMIIFQIVTIIGVIEKKDVFKKEETTTLKGTVKAIFKNDQLLFVAISMSLFMIGYVTTTGFGLHFFKYAYGNEDMYPLFGGILIGIQIVALALFPIFSRRYSRKQLYKFGTILVVIGYIGFFLSPMNMLYIGTSGAILFFGQAFIQLLILMFLADTVEYGQLKLGKRNESVTFALQPFINKIGGAVANFIVIGTAIIIGINEAEAVSDVSAQGIWIMKVAMLIVPLIFILAGYAVYKKKFKIDEDTFANILKELEERGDINLNNED